MNSVTDGYMLARQRLSVARLAYDAGDFHAAMRNISFVFKYIEEVPSGFTASETALAYHLSGKIYLALRMLPEARADFQRSLDLRSGNGNKLDRLSDMRHLAECCRSEKRFDEAEDMLKACISECTGDQVTTLDYAKAAMGLARIYIDCSRLDEAEQILVPTVEKLELGGAESRFWLGRCLLTMARLQHAQDKLHDAMETLNRGLALIEPLLGPSHPLCTRSLSALGKLHMLEGETASGENLCAEAQALSKSLTMHDH